MVKACTAMHRRAKAINEYISGNSILLQKAMLRYLERKGVVEPRECEKGSAGSSARRLHVVQLWIFLLVKSKCILILDQLIVQILTVFE